MADGQKRQSPGRKRLLRRLQAVLCGSNRVRERHPPDSDQIPVRLGVGRLLVFDVLAPANAAVAHGIRLDLTLTLHMVHMQPPKTRFGCPFFCFSAILDKSHALSASCGLMSPTFYTF